MVAVLVLSKAGRYLETPSLWINKSSKNVIYKEVIPLMLGHADTGQNKELITHCKVFKNFFFLILYELILNK